MLPCLKHYPSQNPLYNIYCSKLLKPYYYNIITVPPFYLSLVFIFTFKGLICYTVSWLNCSSTNICFYYKSMYLLFFLPIQGSPQQTRWWINTGTSSMADEGTTLTLFSHFLFSSLFSLLNVSGLYIFYKGTELFSFL